MSNAISRLPIPAANDAAPAALNFPGLKPAAKFDQPFSATLDRMVSKAPARETAPRKNECRQNDQAESAPEPEVRQEQRSPVRGKKKGDDREEKESLAGACGVSGATGPRETLANPLAQPVQAMRKRRRSWQHR